jgi:hypothetical protein
MQVWLYVETYNIFNIAVYEIKHYFNQIFSYF